MSTYSLQVSNSSSQQQTIAVYQQYPDLEGGLPLVWFSKSVPNGNSTTFSWSIDWGLNWGTLAQPLAVGVQWTASGPLQSMDPTGEKGNNAMGIQYTGSEFKTYPLAYHDAEIPSGDLLVTTDTSFTVEDASLMSIAVYMNSLPAFAVQGEPNGKFLFQTHPTYYICTTSAKQGVAVSEEFVSSPTELVFNPGVTSLSYTLNDTLEFVPSS